MRPSSMKALPLATASSSTSFSTSSSYSDFPIRAPRATAMGRPIIPVPGMPTPMAFFRILAESSTSMRSGTEPSSSTALHTHSATAIGSVQPTAGTTSLLTRAMILSLNSFSISILRLRARFGHMSALLFSSQTLPATDIFVQSKKKTASYAKNIATKMQTEHLFKNKYVPLQPKKQYYPSFP